MIAFALAGCGLWMIAFVGETDVSVVVVAVAVVVYSPDNCSRTTKNHTQT